MKAKFRCMMPLCGKVMNGTSKNFPLAAFKGVDRAGGNSLAGVVCRPCARRRENRSGLMERFILAVFQKKKPAGVPA